jgi:hypothetical protein
MRAIIAPDLHTVNKTPFLYHGKKTVIHSVKASFPITVAADAGLLVVNDLSVPAADGFLALYSVAPAATTLYGTPTMPKFATIELFNDHLSQNIKAMAVLSSSVSLENTSASDSVQGSLSLALVQATTSPAELLVSNKPDAGRLAQLASASHVKSVTMVKGEKYLSRNVCAYAPEQLTPLGAYVKGRSTMFHRAMDINSGTLATEQAANYIRASTYDFQVGSSVTTPTVPASPGLPYLPAGTKLITVTIQPTTITVAGTFSIKGLSNTHRTGEDTGLFASRTLTVGAADGAVSVDLPYCPEGYLAVEVLPTGTVTAGNNFNVMIEACEVGAKETSQRTHVAAVSPCATAQSFSLTFSMLMVSSQSGPAESADNSSDYIPLASETLDWVESIAGMLPPVVTTIQDHQATSAVIKSGLTDAAALNVATGAAGAWGKIGRRLRRKIRSKAKNLSSFLDENRQVLSAAASVIPYGEKALDALETGTELASGETAPEDFLVDQALKRL